MNRHLSRNFRAALAIAVICALPAACGNDNATDGNGQDSPGPNEVWMQNTRFDPDELTVSAGDTVTWINRESVTHTVTSGSFTNPAGLFESGTINPGETYRRRFETPGTFGYYCRLHPLQMNGIVIVVPDTTADRTLIPPSGR